MSIETEITRLVGAKQELANWLASQGVTIPNGALLGDLVALLANIPAGGSSTESATVTVTLDANVTLSAVHQFSNGIVTADSTSAGSYTCPVGSLLVLAVTVSGGTIRLNATPVITTTGALVSSTAYLLLRKRQQSSEGFMITSSPVTTTNTFRSGCARMVYPPSIRGLLGQIRLFPIFWRTRSIAVTVCSKRPSSNLRSHTNQFLTRENCHSSWWKMCCQQLSPGRNGWQCRNYGSVTQGQG